MPGTELSLVEHMELHKLDELIYAREYVQWPIDEPIILDAKTFDIVAGALRRYPIYPGDWQLPEDEFLFHGWVVKRGEDAASLD